MGSPVVHWELMSKEPAKLAEFYETVFGWTIRHRAELNYRMVEAGTDGGIGGGIVKPDCDGALPASTLFYIAVDDLGAYRDKIVAAGGKVHIGEQMVPGMGSFALFTDPEGRLVGLWKSASAA